MIKYTFKKVEPKEGFQSVKDRIITKKGVEIDFTLNKMEDNEALLEKQQKEFEPVIENREAIMTNIETHHEFIKDLTDEQRFTVHMYVEAQNSAKQYKAALGEVNDMLEKSAIEKTEIKKQLDIND